MSKHVHGMVVTGYGFTNNNRGNTEGNTTTLQKCNWKGKLHITVSSEAMRYALREDLLNQGLPCNRHYLESRVGENTPFTWYDPSFTSSKKEKYADDDGLGFMATAKGKDDEGKGKAGKGSSYSRTSRFSMNRAISLDPWTGEISYNAASPGASPGAVTEKSRSTTKETGKVNSALYASEYHNTRFQYPFTMTPEDFLNPGYVANYLRAVSQLMNVGGNQARYLYDFSPESVFFRLTDEPCPRFNYCFETDNEGGYDAPMVLKLVKSGDILPSELYVGGVIAETELGKELAKLGCHVFPGVRKCFDAVIATLPK